MARTAARWTAVVALVAGLGACGGDDEPTIATTTSTTEATTTESTTTTTEPELTDEEAITQLVEEWWQVSKDILRAERPIDDAASYLMDPYLERYRTEAVEYLQDFRLEQSPDSALTVESVEVVGEAAVLELCVVDADMKVAASTGEVVDDEVVVTRYRDLIAPSDEGWRIKERQRLGEVEGAVECPAR